MGEGKLETIEDKGIEMVFGDDGRKYLTLEEVHQEELKLLLRFDSICKERALRYSLAGGTLLGAVRHKGFIPWDDDVDLCMPRPDWDKFIELVQRESSSIGLEVRPYFGTEIHSTPLLKVVDPGVAVQAEAENEETNLWLDITPVDGVPSDEEGLAQLYSRASFLRKALMVATTTPESGHSSARRAFKRVVGPMLRAIRAPQLLGSLINNHARGIPYGSSPFVGAVTWGMYGVGEKVPLSGFEKVVSVEFEGHELPCMSCWNEYLTGIYGDYMQLPSEDKRVVHGIKAWRVEQ